MSEDWINVYDPERVAHERLEPGVLGYFAGGAGDEITLADNLAAWKRWRLRPRVMVDLSGVDASSELFGAPLSMPILVAPVAYQRLVHPEGELAMARGAAAAGTAMCLSTLATARPGEVAAAAPEGRRFFQLYEFRDGGITRALMDEAVASGFEAILVTADLPPGGNRERDRRNDFHLPAGLGIPSVEAALGDGRSVTVKDTFDLMDLAADWKSFERLAADSQVPVLLKGLLTGEDAALAVECGAGGVVVSNHGGRQLDCALATGDVLAEVVDAVAGRVPVLVDGGIRRGTDVAIALALGADAVLVGRSPLWGLAAGGQAGVERVLAMLRAEFELALALSGATAPAALTRAHVRRAPAAAVYSVQ